MTLTSKRKATTPALPMLLATDLDGTFLAGNATMRRQLYRMVEAHPEIHMVWVTGRGLETVLPLLSDPALPRPDYVICDVGATVVCASNMQPMQPLQSEIESCWPGENAVAQIMSRFEGLIRQDVPQQRRCSYYCDPVLLEKLRAEIELETARLGCAILYSADHYLDILPRETDKGRTLAALVEQLGFSPQRVLVAGDTLNDLSMYSASFPGVCVGGSEPALLAATSALDNVFHAVAPGCGGILEAIKFFKLLEAKHIRRYAQPIRENGTAELVMVYHRLPYEEVVVDGERVRCEHSSPKEALNN